MRTTAESLCVSFQCLDSNRLQYCWERANDIAGTTKLSIAVTRSAIALCLVQSLLSSMQQETLSLSLSNSGVNSFADLDP